MTTLLIPKPKTINILRNSIDSSNLTKSSSGFSYGLPTWYHNLSIEILVNIFKYFNEKELRTSIGLVSKRWRYASLRLELWKKLQIYGKDVPTSFICRKIRDFTNLDTIHVDNIAEPITVLRQICRCIPNIKHLAVRDCSTIPEAALRNLIQRCKKLESLDLSGTQFRAKRFYEEIAGLMNLKYNESVNLSKNCCLSVRNLLSVVLNCRKLEELKLSTFCPVKRSEQLSDEDASFIICNLAPTLKALILDASTLTNFSFKAIMNCNKLEKLGLYGAGNLSEDVFTKIWQHLPKLKMLKVRHAHQITGQNISELFVSGKEVMQQIVVIDFTGCWKITNVGTEAIANCCESLESLTLKSCKNVRSLRPICVKCIKLRKLNIAFCTNLDLHTILPLPECISTLILDKSDKFSDIIQFASHRKENLHVKRSLSEYNKKMENYLFE